MIRRSLLLIGFLCLLGCGDGDIRGSSEPSPDGKTYLAVMDAGGDCELKVDGKPWPHAVGKAGLIEPGRHSVESCGEIEIDVPPGVVYKFDYWGP